MRSRSSLEPSTIGPPREVAKLATPTRVHGGSPPARAHLRESAIDARAWQPSRRPVLRNCTGSRADASARTSNRGTRGRWVDSDASFAGPEKRIARRHLPLRCRLEDGAAMGWGPRHGLGRMHTADFLCRGIGILGGPGQSSAPGSRLLPANLLTIRVLPHAYHCERHHFGGIAAKRCRSACCLLPAACCPQRARLFGFDLRGRMPDTGLAPSFPSDSSAELICCPLAVARGRIARAPWIPSASPIGVPHRLTIAISRNSRAREMNSARRGPGK
jgi:hypothetical protein